MKRIHKSIPLFGLIALAMTGCSINEKQAQSPTPKAEVKSVQTSVQTNIKNGINDVLQEIKKLEEHIKTSPKQDVIRNYGKMIAKKWDAFEKEVEKKYPKQYETIEKNLYPLIGETGKQKLDVQKIQSLIQKVRQDLMLFVKQIQSS
ncbi:hypothetical protein ACFDTO_34215 [Microbacteriaceae bacterium 4G12]